MLGVGWCSGRFWLGNSYSKTAVRDGGREGRERYQSISFISVFLSISYRLFNFLFVSFLGFVRFGFSGSLNGLA